MWESIHPLQEKIFHFTFRKRLNVSDGKNDWEGLWGGETLNAGLPALPQENHDRSRKVAMTAKAPQSF